MTGMKAYKMSLALDGLCILVSVIILYCANKELLPMGALIAGASVAFILLAAAITLFFKARRIFKQEAAVAREKLMKEQEKIEKETETEETQEESAQEPTAE